MTYEEYLESCAEFTARTQLDPLAPDTPTALPREEWKQIQHALIEMEN